MVLAVPMYYLVYWEQYRIPADEGLSSGFKMILQELIGKQEFGKQKAWDVRIQDVTLH